MQDSNNHPIAILGMACRLPEASTPAQFWNNLETGKSSIQEVPAERWSVTDYYHPTPGTPGKSVSKWGGFIEGVSEFDAAFFGITPEEAAVMDPQHRILLELAYEALESAGYAGDRRKKKQIGVFVGISQNNYEEFTRPLLFAKEHVHQSMVADNLRNVAAGRIAHSLNLSGPNLALDTACSSSLVALHYARLSLLASECDLALVAGINLNLTPTPFVAFSSAGALSPSPRTYLFDERADGFVLGEGGGMILLARLADAQADGDPILALIGGSAVNNDGRTHGLMTPSPVGQQAVMAQAYRAAQVNPDTVSYIEAHGTGTKIGDAIEARSLTRIFKPLPDGRCRFVGSVKTNVGHLLSGAGMPSVIKVVLALQKRKIPPSLNCDQPRRRLHLERASLIVNSTAETWNGPTPLRAGINGFGFGGTNAHIVLEEAPALSRAARVPSSSSLWMITAGTETALQQTATDLSAYLRALPWEKWPDAALSASTARSAQRWRAVLTGDNDLPIRLDQLAAGKHALDSWRGKPLASRAPRVAFLFSGDALGGHQLYRELARFRQLFDNIIAAWTAGDENRTAPQNHHALATKIALVQLLMAWNVEPEKVVGVGRGEVVAAFFAHRLALDSLPTHWAEAGQGTLTLQPLPEPVGENQPRAWISASSGELISRSCSSFEIRETADKHSQAKALRTNLVASGIEILLEIGRESELVRALCAVAGPERSDLSIISLCSEARLTLHSLYAALGQLWISGVPVERERVETGSDMRRLPLPTYPFERQSFWVGSPEEANPRSRYVPQPQEDPHRWLHEVVWEECTLPAPARDGSRHLVIMGANEPLLHSIRDRGHTAEAMTLSLLTTALKTTAARKWLVYFVPRFASSDTVPTDELAQLLSLAQIVMDTDAEWRPAGIYVFTSGAQQSAHGQQNPIPVQALIAGLAFSLNDELGLPTLVVDVDSRADEEEMAAVAIREVASDPQQEMVAWRAGRRYRRSLSPLENRPKNQSVQRRGVYLIVGGVGAVGAAVARGMALDASPTILLAGRRSLVEAPEARALLEKLEWAGAAAEYIQCDVTNQEQVNTLIDHVRERYGHVTGIVHAAGMIRPGRLNRKTVSQFKAVLAPKVEGVRLLWQAVERYRLVPDFFVVFSSITSVLPGFAGGLGDYTAANAYLDAYALALAADGKPLKTINWTIWSDTGQGANQILLAHLARLGLQAVGSDAGYQIFLSALADKRHQLVAVNPELVDALKSNVQLTSMHPGPVAPVEIVDGESTGATVSPSLDNKIELIQELLLELLADELEIPATEIAVDSSFASMGLDSMAAIDLVLTLEQKGFGNLPATLFFEANTVEKLGAYLAQRAPVASSPDQLPSGEAIPPLAEEVTDETRSFALSPVQLAFYTNYRLRPGEVAYAYVRQKVRGPLDIESLQEAVKRLVAAHPMLRASFGLDPQTQQPCQIIHPAKGETAPRVALYEGDDTLEVLENQFVNQLLDIGMGDIMRVLVTRADVADEWHLFLILHHIVADGWSVSLLAQELWQHYTAVMGHDEVAFTPRDADFETYIHLLQGEGYQQRRTDDLDWWRRRLVAEKLPEIALPYRDHKDDAEVEQRALYFSLDATASAELKRMAARNDLSLFHLLLAVYFRCLRQWTGETELVIGVAESQRDVSLSGIQRLVACLADVFPLVLYVQQDEPLLILASKVRDGWLEVQRHTHLSSIDLVRMLPGDAGAYEARTLNEATFSFARFPASLPVDVPIQVLDIVGRTATPATRLALVCWEFDNRLHFTWNYPNHLFHMETVEGLADDVLNALQAAVADHERARDSGLDTVAAGHDDQHFLERIEAQWQGYPERLAITDAEGAITYGALSRHVAYWMNKLLDEGVGAGDVVAFLGDASATGIVALLSILRLGAVWLPLDPEHPAQRLRLQMETANAKLLLLPATEAAEVPQELADPVIKEVVIDLGDANEQPVPPIRAAGVADIAYIIFTSGSTGEPKGVPISYPALDRYLHWAEEQFAYSPVDCVIQVTSLSFDASLRQCLAPLMAGSAIRPVDKNSLHDPRNLVSILEREKITVWSSVPSLWLRLLSTLEQMARRDRLPLLDSLRLIQLGGEALSAGAVRRWQDLFGERMQFANLYGPTEATINATAYMFTASPTGATESIPIGYPLPGRLLQVIGDDGEAVEPGATGELLLGGPSLTPGYLGDGSLTRRKFSTGPSRERFFHTGDLVRQNADGAYLFIGRNDNQVKVRGYRIELEEIEYVLLEHPDIVQAVVVPVTEREVTHLVAFLEIHHRSPDLNELQTFLARKLPYYMLPHRFQILDRLPLLPNRKVDRSRLIVMAESGTFAPLTRAESGTSPRTENEQLLAGIWKRVLGVSEVSREDDFFYLGGDSLSILQVLDSLEELGLSVASAAELYRHRTLAEQAQIVEPVAAQPPPHTTAEEQSQFPLSLAQTGFLMTRSLSPPLATTWCAYFTLEGALDLDVFKHALQYLVERHLMLRAVCLDEARPPLQKIIQPPGPLPVAYERLPLEVSEDESKLAEAIASRLEEEHAHLFDLSQWPLMRMRLCCVVPDRHLWFVTADHFIGDAYSGWLFGSELLAVYDAMMAGKTPDLPSLRTTFRDYVSQTLEREDKIDADTRAYWQATFGTPYDPPKGWYRGRHQGADGNEWFRKVIELNAEQFATLKERAAAWGQTAHALLLTLYYRRLTALTGQTDLVLGTAVAGRDYPLPDLMNIFGSFATILPVRIALGDDDTLLKQHSSIAKTFEAARAHKRAPRQIARLAHPAVPLTALSGLQFLFSFMDFENIRQPESNYLTVRWDLSQTELQPPRLGTDLALSGRALGGHLRLSFTAGAHAMDEKLLAEFTAGFEADLQALLRPESPADPARKPRVSQLEAALVAYLPTRTEVEQMLRELALPATAEGVRSLLFPDGQPRLLETTTIRLGRTGTVCIPRFADELDRLSPSTLAREIVKAGEIAASAGARCISLAGMLPSRTRYAHAVLEAVENGQYPTVTTGHSMTAVSVVKNIQHAIDATSKRVERLAVAFLGLGSVGGSVLTLFLSVSDHPQEILLCDVSASEARLQSLATEIRTKLGYDGEIKILLSSGKAPPQLYSADVIVGATSQPDVLEVEALHPGAIVVDDSFPNCFDRSRAVARMEREGDVMLVGAGLLDCGSVQRKLHLPKGIPPEAYNVVNYFPSVGIPGCQLEALLQVCEPALPPTHGLVTLDSAHKYWQAAEALGLRAARLHMGTYIPDPELVARLQRIKRSSEDEST